MTMLDFLLPCFLLLLAQNAICANILFVAPMPSYSHFSLVFRLAKEMADRGHQVTIINPYPQKNPIANYKDVFIEEVIDYVEGLRKDFLKYEKQSAIETLKVTLEFTHELTRLIFENKNVQNLLKSNQTFDGVVVEHFFNEALMGLGYHFNAPVVVLSTIAAGGFSNFLMANPAPSSYVAPLLENVPNKILNFWERLQNLYLNTAVDVLREVVYLPKHQELFRKYLTSDVTLYDVLRNISIMLINCHVSVNEPVPLVPGVVEIAGFHINPKKLPEDLQRFLDDSNNGVILFSLGSNLKSKDLSEQARKAILKVFSKLKQKVLWKFETDLPEAPSNVKISKWLPQQDVMAHPNVHAFISHGGLLSTIEAVHFGLPVLGIPVYGDQKHNIQKATRDGYAVSLPLDEITEENFSRALIELLENPKYRENVKKRQLVMRDRPMKPIDTAVYWVEHVIRYKGAPHLRSSALDLAWYQIYMIDIIVFLIGVSVTTSVVIFYAVRVFTRKSYSAGRMRTKLKRN